jgi:hypothetical protein
MILPTADGVPAALIRDDPPPDCEKRLGAWVVHLFVLGLPIGQSQLRRGFGTDQVVDMDAGAARLPAAAGGIQPDKSEEATDRQGANAIGHMIGEGSGMGIQHGVLLDLIKRT